MNLEEAKKRSMEEYLQSLNINWLKIDECFVYVRGFMKCFEILKEEVANKTEE